MASNTKEKKLDCLINTEPLSMDAKRKMLALIDDDLRICKSELNRWYSGVDGIMGALYLRSEESRKLRLLKERSKLVRCFKRRNLVVELHDHNNKAKEGYDYGS